MKNTLLLNLLGMTLFLTSCNEIKYSDLPEDIKTEINEVFNNSFSGKEVISFDADYEPNGSGIKISGPYLNEPVRVSAILASKTNNKDSKNQVPAFDIGYTFNQLDNGRNLVQKNEYHRSELHSVKYSEEDCSLTQITFSTRSNGTHKQIAINPNTRNMDILEFPNENLNLFWIDYSNDKYNMYEQIVSFSEKLEETFSEYCNLHLKNN